MYRRIQISFTHRWMFYQELNPKFDVPCKPVTLLKANPVKGRPTMQCGRRHQDCRWRRKNLEMVPLPTQIETISRVKFIGLTFNNLSNVTRTGRGVEDLKWKAREPLLPSDWQGEITLCRAAFHSAVQIELSPAEPPEPNHRQLLNHHRS